MSVSLLRLSSPLGHNAGLGSFVCLQGLEYVAGFCFPSPFVLNLFTTVVKRYRDTLLSTAAEARSKWTLSAEQTEAYALPSCEISCSRWYMQNLLKSTETKIKVILVTLFNSSVC